MTQETIKVLIVDDHTRVRAAIRISLELDEDIEVIGEAANGELAITFCRQQQPDVILMDLIMPVMDGVTASETIHKLYPKIHIIILSSSVEHDISETIERTGAKKFLLKTSSASRVAEAIREVMVM